MRRFVHRLALALAGLALLVVGLRLLLDPLATWRTRRILEGLDGMRGTFSDVEVRVRDLSYAIRDLRIERVGGAGTALPFFEAERARFGLHWRELLRGSLVARIDLDAPKLNVVEAKGSGEASEGGQELEEAPKVGRRLGELAPFLGLRARRDEPRG